MRLSHFGSQLPYWLKLVCVFTTIHEYHFALSRDRTIAKMAQIQ